MKHCFSSLFSGASSGVLLINKTFAVEQANEAAAELLRYTCTELTGHPLESILFCEPYEDKQHLWNLCLAKSDKPIELEKRLTRKDHSLVWVHFCMHSAYDTHTQEWYGLLILTDISYRKELEAKLKKLLQKQEGAMLQIHQQVKHNMALLQLAGCMDNTHTDKHALAKSLVKRAKALPWVYSSLYMREKTSGISLHKHLQNLVRQLILPYDTGNASPRLSLAIEPLYVSAHVANLLSFIVHELMEQALLPEESMHTRLAFGNIPGTCDYRLTWQGKANTSLTDNNFMQSIEMISLLAESLKGETSLSHSPEGCVRLDIRFYEFTRYTERAPGGFAYQTANGR